MANKKAKSGGKMTKKICLLGGLTLALLLVVTVSLLRGADFMSAEANPDYICIKELDNQPCTITACGTWRKPIEGQEELGGYRVCVGRQSTKTAYYTLRIGCAAGYKQYRVGDRGGASGTRGTMPFYESDACEIMQFDPNPPIGELGSGDDIVPADVFDTTPTSELTGEIPVYTVNTYNSRGQVIGTKQEEAMKLYLCVVNEGSNTCIVPKTEDGKEVCGPTRDDGNRICIGNQPLRRAYYSLGVECNAGEKQITVGYRAEGVTRQRSCNYGYNPMLLGAMVTYQEKDEDLLAASSSIWSSSSKYGSSSKCPRVDVVTYRLVDATGKNFVFPGVENSWNAGNIATNIGTTQAYLYNLNGNPVASGIIPETVTGVIYNVPNYQTTTCEVLKK